MTLPPRKCQWRTCKESFIPKRQSDRYCPPPKRCRWLAIKDNKRRWWSKNRGTVGQVKAECRSCGESFRITRSRQYYCDECEKIRKGDNG